MVKSNIQQAKAAPCKKNNDSLSQLSVDSFVVGFCFLNSHRLIMQETESNTIVKVGAMSHMSCSARGIMALHVQIRSVIVAKPKLRLFSGAIIAYPSVPKNAILYRMI